MQTEEAHARLAALGFSEADTRTLFAHFDDAEQRGKLGHGYSRIEWLETLDGIIVADHANELHGREQRRRRREEHP